MALGHPVVVMSDEGGHVLTLRHDVHAGTLGPGDAVQASRPADGDKAGRPGSGEVQARADLDHPPAGQHRSQRDSLGNEAVGKQQAQAAQLLGIQRAAGFNVEAIGAGCVKAAVQACDGHGEWNRYVVRLKPLL